MLLAGPRNQNTVVALIFIIGITSVSLYVSTLARSGLRALMGSIAAIVGFAFILTKVMDSGLGQRVFLTVHAMRGAHDDPPFFMARNTYLIGPLFPFVFLVVLLALALPNYRYAARRPALVALHGAIVFACLVAYDVVVNAIMALRH
jgi:hypothetical protein